jgi:hypothetical protein
MRLERSRSFHSVGKVGRFQRADCFARTFRSMRLLMSYRSEPDVTTQIAAHV